MSKFTARLPLSPRSIVLGLREEGLKLRERLARLVRARALGLELEIALVGVDRDQDVGLLAGDLDRLDRDARQRELRVRFL
jgi:hypothetical protein